MLITLAPGDEGRDARVGLEALHVEVRDEVDDTHRPRDKCDVIKLRARPLDHLQQALHHAAGD